jgi:putative heme iron utilization protein
MKTAAPDPALAKAQAEYTSLLASFQSVQLGTLSKDGMPEASYSPAVLAEGKKFYICVSDMSAHTANMLESGKASVMVIADESASSQIFARKRATFACAVSEIGRGTEYWNTLIELFLEKFGNVVDHIKQMGDFHMLELAPSKGRVVLGFGRAFDVSGENLDVLEHITGIDGEGHRPAEASNGHAAAPAADGAVSLSKGDVERIISHMNEDHLDSVLLYARHFARRHDARSAILKSIDARAMGILLNSNEEITIPFKAPLTSAHDAHMTLVSMSKEARIAIG